MSSDFPCPHCGATVAANARFCRECGADDSVGWDEQPDTDYDGYSPDDDFDYDDFVRREFPDQAPPGSSASSKSPLFVAVIVLLLLSMLVFLS